MRYFKKTKVSFNGFGATLLKSTFLYFTEHEVLNCQSKCGRNYLTDWVCDGKCQTVSTPCKSQCPPGMVLTCEEVCIEIYEMVSC